MGEETTTQTGTTSDQTATQTETGTPTQNAPTPTQAVKWLAQLTNGTSLTGGDNMSFDVNVSAVPPNEVKLFTVSGTTFADTMYLNAGTETWYHSGVVFTPSFPLLYTLADGTTLTIARNSDTPGDLTYTQQ
ncbi:hypothetical protein [Alicyclobacillus fastidiosus]|uniref:Uncharacterized protein n=1 Tax=Alicyclobacillus fastidiosus TaxID=392011 RepID=A0ABV5AK57_9BACL|nr:hypothetical protein [Alicyclobacillus fastidiosus]WEH09264.1 hypothetical protein PYS47_21745 [Alicyclobacillus fastidiosus]